MKDLKAILDLMFKPSERCCPGPDRFGYHSIPVDEILTGKVTLVSPNQNVKIKTVPSQDLILLAINPVIHGFRIDDNVSACRSFLCEIDVGSLESQKEYVKALGFPYSAAIFSGGKSIHYLIVLDQDLEQKTWRLINEWILKIGTLLDQNCKNPSRSVRIPGAIRPETGKKQELIELKERVKLEDLMKWLSKYEHLRPKAREERKGLTNEADPDRFSEWARSQLKNGIDFSRGRNKGYFSIACDFARSGYTEEEAVEFLEKNFVEESDFKEKEFLKAIESGFKYIKAKG